MVFASTWARVGGYAIHGIDLASDVSRVRGEPFPFVMTTADGDDGFGDTAQLPGYLCCYSLLIDRDRNRYSIHSLAIDSPPKHFLALA
jgi:hypothetical protein